MSIQDVVAKFKGYRTVAFNAVAVVVAAVYGDAAVAALQNFGTTADQAVDILVALWGAANIALRAVTTTPIGKK